MNNTMRDGAARRLSGARLRAAREAAGWSREWTALYVNHTAPSVAAWEAARRVPPMNVALALADAFGVTLDELCEPVPVGA